ncbi:hypothetical protein DL766_002075 [Monosporascus sp. MC13-8B]|uniref:Uncharacterized protein n=1 Tax=Monosporascus cannonballus TaxID=155416 RepID=A0ABY0HJZ3_9PEZI|nr:hypothetical protein DL762_000144 [Monosporascus cannonballus]RYO99317.1 hypothetical protein DL763_001596 [Monosporascus cannonballus]RYP36263.1 hypothetical protein DL766_002075 [Monosporascus sp. MC13-8B]
MKRPTGFLSGALPCLLLPSPITSASSLPNPGIATTSANSTNPIADGWYADPDGVKFGDTYWVYATVSVAFGDQGYFDAFSSRDIGNGPWEPHPRVFTAAEGSAWARHSFWAPCAVERGGVYYLYYTANNPVANEEEQTGIGVASSRDPGGPFVDAVDGPLVGEKVNGANPMDQQVFVDEDGATYLVWGGSRANIAPLADDMVSLGDAWPDGSPGPAVADITPDEGYGEGPYMLKHAGRYYFMWSEGGYGTPDYRAAYAFSESIRGPFNRVGVFLAKDEAGGVADGPGHHSVVRDDEGAYWIVYHRRIVGDSEADHRVIAVDRLEFDEDGSIKPVVMT